MKIDLVFLFIICLFIGYTLFDKDKVENMADTIKQVGTDYSYQTDANGQIYFTDDVSKNYIKDAIKEIYMSDVQAIRNLSDTALKLQSTGLTSVGNVTIDGPTNLNNTLNVQSGGIFVNNRTPEGGSISLKNTSKNVAGITNNWTLSNMTGSSYGNKLSFLRYNVDGSNIGPSVDFNDDNNVKMYGSLTTQGDITNVNTNANTTVNNIVNVKDLKITTPVTLPSMTIGNNINFDGTNITVSKYSSVKSRKQDNLYFSEDAIIYQSIFDALSSQVIAKKGNPSGWDETAYKTNLYKGLPILNVGSDPTNTFANGLTITVPVNKTVIWLRILNDRFACFTLFDNGGNIVGIYASSNRNLCKLSPDGGISDFISHGWMPMPVPTSGTYVLNRGGKDANGAIQGADGWLSGIAFSTNPWNHAMNSALAHCWSLNGAPKIINVSWNNSNWNNDILSLITKNTVATLSVPIIYSGASTDKLFYLIEHNNNWDGCSHKGINVVVNEVVNGITIPKSIPIENLRATYYNPLSRQNNKIYNRFIASRIPSSIINQIFGSSPVIGAIKWVLIQVDMTGITTEGIYFREAGTIDY